jgi:hypothetical protein
MARTKRSERQRKDTSPRKHKRQRKVSSPHKSRRKPHKAPRSAVRPRKAKAARHKSRSKRRPSNADRRLEIAIREMNRGRSLSAAARATGFSTKDLQKQLKRKRLINRKGTRWVITDNRLRRVPVMTGGGIRALTVRGFKPAHLAGKHHQVVGQFVRSNDIQLLKPFIGQAVQAANGRRYVLDTEPNVIHRIAAMDTPPFHEIYDVASPT